MLHRSCPLALALVLLTACASAQPHHRTLSDDEWCETSHHGDYERACEVREVVLSADRLDVDAAPNGGITVRTWDRSDVLVRARVESGARTRAEADRLVEETRIRVDGGRVRTEAARTRDGRDRWVSVSYEVFAPARTDLALATVNGGVAVHGVHGDIEARTVNGGISMDGVAGEVVARTTNGGIEVGLDGGAWDGAGLDAETTNGGISMTVPAGYSARLDARTRVGRISASGLSIPEADRQRGRWMGDRVETTLGRGGAPLRLVTQNGGVSIRAER